ncbi:MAG: CoA transferase [Candidatus Lambdaproteobacteria bacterium]|nr:CoA transferase [Candidatus Lambdaproteobacteria bacterium]
MTAPLQDIRVVELAEGLAVAAACAYLADLGAAVVKIEPPGGDPARGRRLPWAANGGPLNPGFQMDNRGKRSLTLDTGRSESAEVLAELLRRADIFATDLDPEAQGRRGLTLAALAAVNGRLVHVTLTPYGSRGPGNRRPGNDYHAFWARSGIMGMMGEPPSAPSMQRPGMGDHAASINLVTATMAALRQRDVSGRGVGAEVTLHGSGIWMLAADIASTHVAQRNSPRQERPRALNPFRNHYRTRDGHWLFLVMPQPKVYWAKICRALGREEWLDAARHGSYEQMMERHEALVGELDRLFAGRDFEEWKRRLDAEKLIWAPGAELPQVVEDPQLHAMAYFPALDVPGAGRLRTVAAPVRIEGVAIGPQGPAPEPGQHTDAILGELGYDAARIARLRGAGVLG